MEKEDCYLEHAAGSSPPRETLRGGHTHQVLRGAGPGGKSWTLIAQPYPEELGASWATIVNKNRQAKENRSLRASVYSALCKGKDACESDELVIPPPPGLEHFADRPMRASRARSESLFRSDSGLAERDHEGTQWPAHHHE